MHIPLVLLSFLPLALTQGVTQLIVPSATPPAGCENSRQGQFTITVVNVTDGGTSTPSPSPSRFTRNPRERALHSFLPRQESGVLTLTLVGGVLHDSANRTGYIASNYQFQFDKPPQAGAIYTAGFGICSNATLSLGGSAVFWQCLSGDFYNLYDRDWATHCVPVYLEVREGLGSAYSTSPPGPESTGPDQNTIANGGGTQSANATATATFGATGSGTSSGGGSGSVTGSATGTGSASSSGGSSASGTGSSSGSSSASQTASSSSSAGGAGLPSSVPQQVLAWVAGIVGAAVLV